MNLNHFLNAIVTALSVATVLITLMSFLIFKVRQFPKKGSEDQEKIDGTFFRKFDPFRSSARLANGTVPNRINEVRRLQITAIGFFAAVSVAIFTAVVVQSVMSDRAETAKAESIAVAKLRQTKAHDSHVAELQKRGLMQRYPSTNNLGTSNIEEFISASQKQVALADSHVLSTFHVILVTDASSLNRQSPYHRTSVAAWTKFFRDTQTEFQSVDLTNLSSITRTAGETTVVILPQLTALDRASRRGIQELRERGIAVIATGAIGAVGAEGRPAPTDWSGRVFGVTFASNDFALKFEPTIFGADRAPFAKIGAGFMADWFPTDNNYVGIAKDPDSASAFQTNYNGKISETARGNTVARAVFTHPKAGARAIWLAMEPGTLQKLSVPDRFYAESFLTSSLLWVAQQPVATLANWKNGASSAFLTSVDSEDKFEGATRLLKLFDSKSIPATFYIVSNLLVKDPGLAKAAKDAKTPMDLQSHTTDHTILEGLNLATQFDKIQDSRLAIEEITGNQVFGFRPPEERFDEATLSAALQNHIKYIFGDQRHYRYSPLQIASGDLIYFPRSVFDDFNLRDQNYTSDGAMLQKMKSDFAKAKLLGGAYFLSTHSQVFGQNNYQAAFGDFLTYAQTEKPWFANYAQVTGWWRDREQVRITLALNSAAKKFELLVKNDAGHPLDDLAVFIDAPDAENWAQVSSTPPNSPNLSATMNATTSSNQAPTQAASQSSSQVPVQVAPQARGSVTPELVKDLISTEVSGDHTLLRIAKLKAGETIKLEAAMTPAKEVAAFAQLAPENSTDDIASSRHQKLSSARPQSRLSVSRKPKVGENARHPSSIRGGAFQAHAGEAVSNKKSKAKLTPKKSSSSRGSET